MDRFADAIGPPETSRECCRTRVYRTSVLYTRSMWMCTRFELAETYRVFRGPRVFASRSDEPIRNAYVFGTRHIIKGNTKRATFAFDTLANRRDVTTRFVCASRNTPLTRPAYWTDIFTRASEDISRPRRAKHVAIGRGRVIESRRRARRTDTNDHAYTGVCVCVCTRALRCDCCGPVNRFDRGPTR